MGVPRDPRRLRLGGLFGAGPGSARLRLSCREVYLHAPDAIGDDDLICDVAFPLAEH